jgi:CheY-like chemotaxis protein
MRRVLIVEDEVLIGLVLEDILDMLGCTVAGNAASFDEATTMVNSLGPNGFDTAILDVNLGVNPVYPLADRIMTMGIPIIFATGSHPDSLPERFTGCTVLEKPYAFAAVEASLGHLAAAA